MHIIDTSRYEVLDKNIHVQKRKSVMHNLVSESFGNIS